MVLVPSFVAASMIASGRLHRIAPELEGRTGLMFNQKGLAILPTAELTPEHVSRLVGATEALIARGEPAAHSSS